MNNSLLLLLLVGITPLMAVCCAKGLVPWGVVLLLAMAWRLKQAAAPLDPKPLLWHAVLIGLLLLWPLVTLAWGLQPASAFHTWLQVLLTMSVGALVVAWLPPLVAQQTLPLEKINRYALGSFALALALALWEGQVANGPIAFVTNLFRAVEKPYVVTDMNRGLCLLALWVWPLCVLLFAERRKLAARLLPWLVLPVVATLWSLSATVGLLMGCLMMEGLRLFPRVGRWVMLVLLPLAVLSWPWSSRLLGCMNMPGSVYELLPASAQHRVMIWRFGYEKAMEAPLLGWGMDASRHIPGGNDYYAPHMANMPLHPHNSMMQILLEQGLIGFCLSGLALAWVMYTWDRARYPSPETKAFAAGAITTYLMIGLSAFGMWQFWWVASAWLTASALACTLAIGRGEAAKISHG